MHDLHHPTPEPVNGQANGKPRNIRGGSCGTNTWLTAPREMSLRQNPRDIKVKPPRVRRGFRNIRATLPCPAGAPKPGEPGPGRPPGSANRRPAPRYDVGKPSEENAASSQTGTGRLNDKLRATHVTRAWRRADMAFIEHRDAAGRLAEIRAYPAAFDWERDDRRYALQKTEQIITGGDRRARGTPPRPLPWSSRRPGPSTTSPGGWLRIRPAGRLRVHRPGLPDVSQAARCPGGRWASRGGGAPPQPGHRRHGAGDPWHPGLCAPPVTDRRPAALVQDGDGGGSGSSRVCSTPSRR
jgi:hypothetical protein